MPLPPEQIKARKIRLVAAAKAVFSGQVGLTVGSFRVRNKLSHLDLELLAKYPIFEEYRSALPIDIPVGTERLHWNTEVVLKSDSKLAKLEFKFRAKLLQSCADIIKEYS